MTKDAYHFQLSLCAYDRLNEGKEFGRIVQWLFLDRETGRFYAPPQMHHEPDPSVKDAVVGSPFTTAPTWDFGDAENVLAAAPANRQEFARAEQLRAEILASDFAEAEEMQRLSQFYNNVLGRIEQWFRDHRIPVKESDDLLMDRVEAIFALLDKNPPGTFRSRTALYTEGAKILGEHETHEGSAYERWRNYFKLHFFGRMGTPTPSTVSEWRQFYKERKSKTGKAE